MNDLCRVWCNDAIVLLPLNLRSGTVVSQTTNYPCVRLFETTSYEGTFIT